MNCSPNFKINHRDNFTELSQNNTWRSPDRNATYTISSKLLSSLLQKLEIVPSLAGIVGKHQIHCAKKTCSPNLLLKEVIEGQHLKHDNAYTQIFKTPYSTNENALENVIQIKLNEFREKKIAVPADLRLELFKHLMKDHPKNTEKVPSKILRLIFDYDLTYIKSSLENWKTKKDQAQKALQNIEFFMEQQTLPDEMTFQEHAYYCFCLSALMSGIEIKDLDKEYNAQIHTMVRGVIHPEGNWSIKSVLEDQSYAKFIFHVSKKGLSTIQQSNYMTSFRIAPDAEFNTVRLAAIACDETVEFDGVKDCGSLKVLKHDFIHAGFLKYQFDNTPEIYRECLRKVGLMGEYIRADKVLQENPELRRSVEAAFFMWNHELTTSIFVDGWPRSVPLPRAILSGEFGSAPQLLLRLGAKLSLPTPELFREEINCEQLMLKSVGCTVNGLTDTSMSDHEKVKEIMSLLNPGYAYLYENFHEFYGVRSKSSIVFNRIKTRLCQ